MSPRRAVHVVVPDGVDDPLRPSGGNTYDRRLCEELTATGWSVRVRQVAGCWPWAEPESRARLADALRTPPEGSVVLVDGLVALAAPEVVVPASRRLRTVVLVHMPVGAETDRRAAHEGEGAVLRSATAVVATSTWTRSWLLARHRLEPSRVHVAAPGVDAASPACGSADGGGLLCVGAVTPAKGYDVLVRALSQVAGLRWRCTCVGALDRAPAFVAALRGDIRAAGLGDRVELTGPLTGGALDAAYAAADVLVLASRAETYGMVVAEALARGLPVLASEVGGVPEAVGSTPTGERPGLLTPVGDASALAGSLRCWLEDATLRQRLRRAARQRRSGLTGWADTAQRVAHVLEEAAA